MGDITDLSKVESWVEKRKIISSYLSADFRIEKINELSGGFAKTTDELAETTQHNDLIEAITLDDFINCYRHIENKRPKTTNKTQWQWLPTSPLVF